MTLSPEHILYQGQIQGLPTVESDSERSPGGNMPHGKTNQVSYLNAVRMENSS
jgi:hypothetical protein